MQRRLFVLKRLLVICVNYFCSVLRSVVIRVPFCRIYYHSVILDLNCNLSFKTTKNKASSGRQESHALSLEPPWRWSHRAPAMSWSWELRRHCHIDSNSSGRTIPWPSSCRTCTLCLHVPAGERGISDQDYWWPWSALSLLCRTAIRRRADSASSDRLPPGPTTRGHRRHPCMVSPGCDRCFVSDRAFWFQD